MVKFQYLVANLDGFQIILRNVVVKSRLIEHGIYFPSFLSSNYPISISIVFTIWAEMLIVFTVTQQVHSATIAAYLTVFVFAHALGTHFPAGRPGFALLWPKLTFVSSMSNSF